MGAFGRRVLVCCEDALERSVCVTVAILLCHYPESCNANHILTFVPQVSIPNPLTKDCLRQCLRLVAVNHPQAQPTRGMLKQVFNYCQAVHGGFSEFPQES